MSACVQAELDAATASAVIVAGGALPKVLREAPFQTLLGVMALSGKLKARGMPPVLGSFEVFPRLPSANVYFDCGLSPTRGASVFHLPSRLSA